jgi:hypothetical protein
VALTAGPATRRLTVARRHRQALAVDRRTLALGVAASAALVAVVAVELGRVWQRGSAPLPQETDDLLGAAETAAVETAAVARAGYREVSERENALFNLVTSFAATFLLARWITFLLRGRQRVGPFRDLRLGRRRIHHFVPGIVLAFATGTAAIVTRDERVEARLAVPFGVGMGLTLDESALLLELEDVYWSREGILSVQITLSVIALLASIALGLRFLRRGEELVLELV